MPYRLVLDDFRQAVLVPNGGVRIPVRAVQQLSARFHVVHLRQISALAGELLPVLWNNFCITARSQRMGTWCLRLVPRQAGCILDPRTAQNTASCRGVTPRINILNGASLLKLEVCCTPPILQSQYQLLATLPEAP